jgi:hypothetical protein
MRLDHPGVGIFDDVAVFEVVSDPGHRNEDTIAVCVARLPTISRITRTTAR